VVEQLDRADADAEILVGRTRLKVTSLDKPLWPSARPAVTKRDFLRYLATVSPVLLPHLADRPVFATRAPDGADGKRFFQRKFPDAPDFVKSIPVWSTDNDSAVDLLRVSDLATLLWLGQMAALELHAWFSRVARDSDGRALGTDYASSAESVEASRLNYPDFLVVDLDAYRYSGKEAEGEEPRLHRAGFEMVRTVALEIREIVQALGLVPFVKTSGKTGLHVYLPIRRRFTFDEVRQMARAIGEHAERRLPRLVTLAWSVPDRRGKVFFDFNQNVRGKSLAVPYTPRLHPSATVSMPLTWDALPAIYPTDFTVHTVPALVARDGDAWRDILAAKTDLGDALDVVEADEEP
jgi:bifunctional non-homologous end joining protein LigD